MPIGGGGPLDDIVDTDDRGRGKLLLDVFRRCERCDTDEVSGGGFGASRTARPGMPGIIGAAPAGGRGAEGGFGADGCSESDKNVASWTATCKC